MTAPDKIYVWPDGIGPNVSTSVHVETPKEEGFVEYINKETMLDMLNNAIQHLSDGSLAGYYESLIYENIIDKINEL